MKSLFYKISIIILVILVCFYVFFSNNFKKERVEEKNIHQDKIENNENANYNSNIVKDIRYSSKDLKGNEYIIIAKEGEIDLNNSDIIFLKDVTAYIKLIKNNEFIKIVSNYGKYNTINYDTIFSKKVQIDYIDNTITGDYLDFSMIKNQLIISKNVIYKGKENILKADVLELDTITKDTKIFMHDSKKKVNVKGKN